MSNNEFICFSIGENCLTDSILDRNNLKSFSSPFSSSRSNIEYIINFEKENYAHFIDNNFLKYEFLNDSKKVVRNKKYIVTENKYNYASGFEFTHHDVIGNEAAREAFERRYKRIVNLTNRNLVIVYHHRKCDKTDMSLLVHHLNELAEIYESRQNKVTVFAFYQIIVSNAVERKVESYSVGNVHMYKFYTLNEWAGTNDDIFWAKCDDDLLKIMVNDIKKESSSIISEN